MTTRSAVSARPTPPPAATPFTADSQGTGSACSASAAGCHCWSIENATRCPVLSPEGMWSVTSARSAPAQKPCPAPVSTNGAHFRALRKARDLAHGLQQLV